LPSPPQPHRAGERRGAGLGRAGGRRRRRRLPVPDRVRHGGGMSADAVSLRPAEWTVARQAWAMTKWELRRIVSWRKTCLVLIAFAPVVVILAHATMDRGHRLEEETLVVGAILFFHIRFAIYFACLGVFMRLVRGEIAEKTLHYVLLAPLRR